MVYIKKQQQLECQQISTLSKACRRIKRCSDHYFLEDLFLVKWGICKRSSSFLYKRNGFMPLCEFILIPRRSCRRRSYDCPKMLRKICVIQQLVENKTSTAGQALWRLTRETCLSNLIWFGFRLTWAELLHNYTIWWYARLVEELCCPNAYPYRHNIMIIIIIKQQHVWEGTYSAGNVISCHDKRKQPQSYILFVSSQCFILSFLAFKPWPERAIKISKGLEHVFRHLFYLDKKIIWHREHVILSTVNQTE